MRIFGRAFLTAHNRERVRDQKRIVLARRDLPVSTFAIPVYGIYGQEVYIYTIAAIEVR